MIPEISEFSYGFALTNELVGWTALSSAPVFPSLIEEGKRGGGYDVKLDQPGAPLFIQFKRADCMTRASASEIRYHSLPLTLPFYRFPITQRNKSFQHTSLVELDDGSNFVFYAAPRFHLLSEINDAWQAQDVATRSIFVAPREIGFIYDNDRHHVSYDARNAFFCSEPTEIKPISASVLEKKIKERLSTDSRPVWKQLPEWLDNIRGSRAQARERQSAIQAEIEARKRAATDTLSAPGLSREEALRPSDRLIAGYDLEADEDEPTPEPGPEIREGRELSTDEQTLRNISDEGLHGFGSQFFVVQPKS